MTREHSFSAQSREYILQRMSQEPLDILIIGGGITGVGIAWDASQRGLKTGLIEMNDYASGTSSRSTKLVHGGLRYLKQGEVKLVHEVGRERRLLHEKAAHLVTPIPMILPIYKGGSLGYLATSFGLYAYDWLAGVKKSERRTMLSREETLKREPMLKAEGLRGSGLYYEYRTDDARLTIEVAKTAAGHGAMLVNYAKAEGFVYEAGRVSGVQVKDRVTGKGYTVYARTIVNAAGPWADRVRVKDGPVQGKKLLLTKGVHLVVDYALLPIRQAAYFDAPDGRMIFVIPRDGKTYIGTTDTLYEGEIGRPVTTEEDLNYLLKAVNVVFPTVSLNADNVESMWAGLRPLIHEEGKKPSEVSRKDEIFQSASGLLTIAGGKLTGFRKMAEKVVNRVVTMFDERSSFAPCRTDQEMLSGGGTNEVSFAAYRDQVVERGCKLGLSQSYAAYLVSRYGSNTTVIYDSISTALNRNEAVGDQANANKNAHAYEGASESACENADAEAVDVDVEANVNVKESIGENAALDTLALKMELEYCITYEMAVSAADYMLRRSGRVLFDRKYAEEISEQVLHYMAERLGWDARRVEREREQLQQAFNETMMMQV